MGEALPTPILDARCRRQGDGCLSFHRQKVPQKAEEPCRHRGIGVLNLSAAFKGQDPDDLHVSALDYHPNRRASAIAGASVVGFLCWGSVVLHQQGASVCAKHSVRQL